MIRTLLLVSTFLSAVLLFTIQPLYSKVILPHFGGSSAVWTISIFFYSVVLFIGYVYAALLNTWSSRVARIVHTGLLVVSAGLLLSRLLATGSALPVAIVSVVEPAWAVFLSLLQVLGLSVLLLSSTSVIVQKLYAQHTQEDPYALFAVSNAGSLLGLLSYPFLLEPFTALSSQVLWWTVGYVLFTLLFLSVWRQVELTNMETSSLVVRAERLQQPVRIVLVAAIPTLLLAAGTELFSSGIASFPLLWVLPLALYLLSFIFGFSARSTIFDRFALGPLVFLLLVPVLITLPYIGMNATAYWSTFFLFLTFFFFVCLYFHRHLYTLRPQLSELGNFYVLMTFGGALGSGIVGLLLPILLNDQIELYVLLAVLLVYFSRKYLEVLLQRIEKGHRRAVQLFVYVWAILFCFVMVFDTDALLKNRNFYGTLLVQDREQQVDSQTVPIRSIYNGATNHGLQVLEEPYAHQPVSYYGPQSGVGVAIETLTRQEIAPRLLAVGLGAGVIAAYCDQVETIDFVEINPAVVTIAQTYFTYLTQCLEKTTISVGDGRLVLEKLVSAAPLPFDIIVIDAFTDDAIPTHLLTNEALLEAYLPLLSARGIIAFHISNRYLDLASPIAGVAEKHGLAAVVVAAPAGEVPMLQNPSVWVLVMPSEQVDAVLSYEHTALYEGNTIVWTDEKNSVMQVLSLKGSVYQE